MSELDPVKCEAGGCALALPQHPVIKPGDAFDPAEDRVVVQVPPGWLVAWSRKGMDAGRMVVLCPVHAAGAVRGGPPPQVRWGAQFP